jgi:HPt (histidine-containing phosphotransfer) domain-containing protein
MTQPFESPKAPRDPEATRKLLASLWERNLPILRERCAQLERAVAAAQAGTLTQQLREETIDTAHKLAGSLGMFGYPEGTEFARRIEEHLESTAPIDAPRFARDVAAMRATLPV